jgi:gamma-glutamyl-gamma-aminobutyraldehyde dehydrogenase
MLAVKEALSRLQFVGKAFINGRLMPAVSGQTFISGINALSVLLSDISLENPATGKPITDIASCDERDVDLAVKAARNAFESGVWAKKAPSERKKILLKFADLVEQNSLDLALLDSIEAGKPIFDCSTIDLPDSVHCFRWHAELTDKIYDQVAPTSRDNVGIVIREPVGVVGAVAPWNFPVVSLS